MDDLLTLAQTLAQHPTRPITHPIKNRVAYVVSHGQSYASHGYAIRTQGIAKALNQHGLETLCFVRPNRPWELDPTSNIAPEVNVEGVRYIHSRWPSSLTPSSEHAHLQASVETLVELFRVFRPAAVLAASNWQVGLPAWIAAKRLGLPFYNEVRGFWELSRAVREPSYANSSAYHQAAERDTFVAKQASKVFTLNSPMQTELVKRGVEAKNIALVPNGVNHLPEAQPADPALKKRLGIQKGEKIVGYIGSFSAYEGLDVLLKACTQLVQNGEKLKLLLVGDDQPLTLKDKSESSAADIAETSLTKTPPWLIQVGRVPHEQVADYYALLDAVVIPRKKLPVCELVPPMKAAEALAYGKRLVVSDLPALRAVCPIDTGVSFITPDDAPALAEGIKQQLAQSTIPITTNRTAIELINSTQSMSEVLKNLVVASPPVNNKLYTGNAIGSIDSTNHKMLRVAAVMDEFTYHCYEPECELLQLDPEHCLDQLEKFVPDLLFIESAWKGKNDKWQTKISNNAPEIIACIDWCKSRGIPTMFWNKEDPVHFSTFQNIATQVDYVFTTDIDCIPKYKKVVKHERVGLLPFAAQPKLHNPIEKFERKDAFNFAGSYYLRYPERQRDFAALIDTVGMYRPVDIFDRNFEKPHPHYNFPEKYKPMILGSLPFSEIDRAYKGYRYGINMNTIKQSQTMFARRVFELLASNTIVVSNFSRGIRLLFGDLVVASDTATELSRELKPLCEDETVYRRKRLQGLRAVMLEHTYSHRMDYIKSFILGEDWTPKYPKVVIVGISRNAHEQRALIKNYKHQKYENCGLLLINKDVEKASILEKGIKCFPSTIEGKQELIDEIKKASLVSLFDAEDFYGSEYIRDLALTTAYCQADAFGKVSYYERSGASYKLVNDGHQYHEADVLTARSSMVKVREFCLEMLDEWEKDSNAKISLKSMISTDEFHYCRKGSDVGEDILKNVLEDLFIEKPPVSFAHQLALLAKSLKVSSRKEDKSEDGLPQLSASELYRLSNKNLTSSVKISTVNNEFLISSYLPEETHAYIWLSKTFSRDELNLKLNSQFRLDAFSDIYDIRTVFEFLDKNNKKISHSMNGSIGGKHSLAIPPECKKVRFGLRVKGSGSAAIRRLILGSYGEQPEIIAARSQSLILTKQYPDYSDLYRYGFLHSRVRAYHQNGLPVDIFRITNIKENIYREFEGFDVTSGNADLLDATLSTGQYKHVLVHLLDKNMWQVLEKHLDKIKVTVWVHGAEIQVWQRRSFEFERMTHEEINRQKKLSDHRKKFWQSILKQPHSNLTLVFVSNYFLKEVEGDLGVNIPIDQLKIIHNYIDGNTFKYIKKDTEQRKKILSIRPYASRKYANDLSVDAILKLSEKPFFDDLEFCLIGDGELFDSITAPLTKFNNVEIIKKFLRHDEISLMHRKFGVFLTPTRMDAQGVSRDEAMSSGLVPITNLVAAIPEFVDDSCGFMADAEDSEGLAAAIEKLYFEPQLFSRLSEAASLRANKQSGFNETIGKEICLIKAI